MTSSVKIWMTIRKKSVVYPHNL